MVEVYGKLAYFAKKNGKDIIVYDEQEFGEEYDRADYPFELDRELAYTAMQNGKYFIVYQGKKYSEEYDSLNRIRSLNGKVAFITREGSKGFVMYGGKKVSKEYDTNLYKIQNLEIIGGKVMYVVEEKRTEGIGGESVGVGSRYHVFSENEKVGVYDYIFAPSTTSAELIDINGQLAFRAQQGDKWVVVYGGKKAAEYDDIDHLTSVAGKLAFTARVGSKDEGKTFIVMEK
ncbi:MAG: hypothetical protein AABY40_02475 [Nanoarchaeota archaeon]